LSKSKIKFDRWSVRQGVSSWAFQVYQKHNKELTEMYISHLLSKQYTYQSLTKNGAEFKDLAHKHFDFRDKSYSNVFNSIQTWSDNFNKFDNWTNLNTIMAMSANLETYMATIIKLALESDIGVTFNATRKIDGIEIIKNSDRYPFELEEKIISCTKGDWSSRVSNFEKIFTIAPNILKDNISSLDKIRKLRNDIGHAFGREIDKSRDHNILTPIEIQTIKQEKIIEYLKLLFAVARAIDRQLMSNHIGEYQALYFFHNLRPSLKEDENIERRMGNHARIFQKELSIFGENRVSKLFCKGLVEYYEKL